ncbi:MAG: tripartite tricarboxylate transporter substrate binding protein [Betaproteobacteria bacterium]|nr:tripartite tricarboxylate transporter substrate binding protein [Gammaproteobacteria bacterium]MDH3438779.1 tripartite tricarboxylate transporter substrate binding protein [Betaproteobacteria bacterium]
MAEYKKSGATRAPINVHREEVTMRQPYFCLHPSAFIIRFALALAMVLSSTAVVAQAYPAKPVRIMVGYSPGGGVDTTARIVGAALANSWHGTVIVENRPGASGNIATEYTAKAAPDGYTLVLCNIGSHGVTPARFRKTLKYDPVRDFAFVAKIGGVPNVFMVHPSMPMKTLGEYIRYAKAHPGKLNFGSSGVGGSPHLSIQLFITMTGINIVHIPYKGAAAALTDVMSGHVESSVGNLAGGPLGAIKAGRVRALAVTSAKRNAQVPDVPTFAESGVPGYDVTGWYGLCTQAKVPQAVQTKINTDLNTLLSKGAPLRKRLEAQGITVTPGTQEAFAAHVKSEIARWTKVVQEAKLEATKR